MGYHICARVFCKQVGWSKQLYSFISWPRVQICLTFTHVFRGWISSQHVWFTHSGRSGGGSGNKICGQTKHLSSMSWSAVITSVWTRGVLEKWNQLSMYLCYVSSPTFENKEHRAAQGCPGEPQGSLGQQEVLGIKAPSWHLSLNMFQHTDKAVYVEQHKNANEKRKVRNMCSAIINNQLPLILITTINKLS